MIRLATTPLLVLESLECTLWHTVYNRDSLDTNTTKLTTTNKHTRNKNISLT